VEKLQAFLSSSSRKCGHIENGGERDRHKLTWRSFSSKLIMQDGCRKHCFNFLPNCLFSVRFWPQLTSELLGFYEFASGQNGSAKWYGCINQFIDWSTYSLTSLFVSDSLTT
jgi:hypothetical protein